ncbi:HAD-IA family hydrolase [Planococcus lenghuensis]|uniref:Phosphoglycolate phosphatase n=1 Tax=Planococcus lenghuensis TaxID=2213202 RepID=A0A1Q2KZT1_9BACL|nr:HAD-IA family hydrolase [Planococcus lenghuensis]AQQ53152.1 phosphoglycolate phosphatase [Planococcus lenghuensis]
MNILWDFDGTLFDTYPAYAGIFSNVLNDEVSETEVYGKLKISFSHAIDHYQLTKEQVDELDRLKEKLDPTEFLPFDQVEEVLKWADKNVIMTHKDRMGVQAVLAAYGWEPYFTELVTMDNGFPRKPDTAAYQYLHDKYNIDLVVGDRELDLLPAKALGIATCMFQGNSEVADYRLDHYRDFFDVISSEVRPRSD